MRPDLQQDPRPEFGIPVPRETGRHGIPHEAHPETYLENHPGAGPAGGPETYQPAPWAGGQHAAPYGAPIPGQASGPISGSIPGSQPIPQQNHHQFPQQMQQPVPLGASPQSMSQPMSQPMSQAMSQPIPQPVSQPVSPYGGGPYSTTPPSGPQPVAAHPVTGSWAVGERPMSGSQAMPRDLPRPGAAEPTVRHHLADDLPENDRPAPEHPSGPLPTSGRRRSVPARGRGRGRRTALLALVAAGAVAAGAAGYVAIAHWGTSSQDVAPTAGVAAPTATSLTGANLATKQSPLGVIATSDGYTLYSFTKDTNKPSASTCVDTCAQQWPPVLASDGDPWLKGIDASRVGTVDRPDGTKQLTLNGWPLYRYAKDAAPGDTAGNGVGGTWRAVGPDGKPVAADATAANTAPAPQAQAPQTQAPQDSGSGSSSAGSGYGDSGAASSGY